MGNVQSYVVPSLTVGSLYLVYSHIYCSYTLLKTNVLNNDRLPSFVYLYIKHLIKALTRRTGCLYTANTNKREVVYTVFNCRWVGTVHLHSSFEEEVFSIWVLFVSIRLRTVVLRRFCSAAGYGWDYPDTEYRDIPLCFPEFLCHRLLLMVLTDENFMLSPAGLTEDTWTFFSSDDFSSVCQISYTHWLWITFAGLVRVRQSLKTLEPVDELKKGPFMLQVRVLEYQQVEAGVEVNICLSATSRTGSLVWESILTLLSKNKLHDPSRCVQRHETESERQSRDFFLFFFSAF